MTKYFGERWHVPATQGAFEAKTPVGERCGDCQRPIREGDRGFILSCIGQESAYEVPFHRECQFSGTSGHIFGVCGCTGDARTPDEKFALACEAWNRAVAPDLRTDVTGHTPWNSMKARRTLGSRIEAAAFRIGQSPELEELQKRLLVLEARAFEEIPHPVLFGLHRDSAELMVTISKRLFGESRQTPAEILEWFTENLNVTAMPQFLNPMRLVGVGLFSFEDQVFQGGQTKRTWFLHFVSVAGDAWRIIRYPGIEPITLLDAAAGSEESIIRPLDRLVRAAALQLEVNEADPGLHAVRRVLGVSDETAESGD